MNRRERLTHTFAGEPTDRLPVALWRHFPGDDQRAADLARAVAGFQQQYDWDFVVVQPSANFNVTGYGLQDDWVGQPSGRRKIKKRVVHRSLDWTELRILEPSRGDTGKQVECLHLLGDTFGEDIPFLQVIYSPLTQAARLAGNRQLMRNLRTQPDRLRSGLNVLTDSTLRLIDLLRRTRIAGIVYVIEHANYSLMSEVEYQNFGMPFDRKILEALPDRWWFNMLHLMGDSPMLRLFTDYPTQVIHAEDRYHRSELDKIMGMFPGAVCGGLHEQWHLHRGTPATIRDAVRQVVKQAGNRRLILGAGRAVPVTTPLSNLQAVRDSVNMMVY